MCWISKTFKPLHSEENVPIYKILRVNSLGKLEAYFRGNDYVLNQLYEEELGHYLDPFISRHIVDEGIHCYSAACKFERDTEGIFVETMGYRNLYKKEKYLLLASIIKS